MTINEARNQLKPHISGMEIVPDDLLSAMCDCELKDNGELVPNQRQVECVICGKLYTADPDDAIKMCDECYEEQCQ